jgi:hypothetical protein
MLQVLFRLARCVLHCSTNRCPLQRCRHVAYGVAASVHAAGIARAGGYEIHTQGDAFEVRRSRNRRFNPQPTVVATNVSPHSWCALAACCASPRASCTLRAVGCVARRRRVCRPLHAVAAAQRWSRSCVPIGQRTVWPLRGRRKARLRLAAARSFRASNVAFAIGAVCRARSPLCR